MRPIDAELLTTNIAQIAKNCARSDAQKALIGRILFMIENMPTIETEPVKHDTELSSILQDYGIKDTDTLRYILDQYQKIIVDITGGQMSYLTYPAQAVIDCTNDYYLSSLADLKESSNNEAEPDNGWISVKDRLPDGDGNFYEGGLEESKYVLVYGCYEDHYGYGIGTYIRDHIDHDAGWSGCLSGVYELDCCNVTHWRHLPEPPKGE